MRTDVIESWVDAVLVAGCCAETEPEVIAALSTGIESRAGRVRAQRGVTFSRPLIVRPGEYVFVLLTALLRVGLRLVAWVELFVDCCFWVEELGGGWLVDEFAAF